eukprot:g2673.t1
MILLIGLGGGGLAVFGVLFAAVYYVGHHVGKRKHGAATKVISPTTEEEKVDDTLISAPDENNQENMQEETPVTDMKTGERVRALSKHTELEDFMNQTPSRKTKTFDDDTGAGGVKKAWI